MFQHSNDNDELFAAYKKRLAELKQAPKEDVYALLRGIGMVGADGKTTTLFGGESEPDRDAMAAHRKELYGDNPNRVA